VIFVDTSANYIVMRRRRVTTAFAFNPDFAAAGFTLFEG
jgi:predicted nucleic acid-binding protein